MRSSAVLRLSAFALAACQFLVPTLRAQLSLTSQPQAVTVQAGQPATFSATATPSNAAYQWRRNGYAIPGATRATFTIAAASQGDADNYDVTVSSAGLAISSAPARLWVTPVAYPASVAVDLDRSLRLEGPDGGTLSAVAALPDGRFYVLGNFIAVGGTGRRFLERFNPNGSIDESFLPPVFDSAPTSLALQIDGKLLLAGPFEAIDGVPTGGLVRLNADGTRDATFAVGRGFSRGVGSVFVTPSGTIYVMGGLGTYQGAEKVHYEIAKLTPTGAIDPLFVAPTFQLGQGTTNANGWAVTPSGLVYVYGGFDRVNNVSRGRVARLLPDGAVDPAFNPGTGPNSWVYAMIVLSNGQLVLGGEFTSYNGTPAGRLVRLNPDGAIDPSFAIGSGFSSQVNFLHELPGGNLFVSSIASTFKGSYVPSGVRLSPAGNLDSTFSYSLFSRPDRMAVLPGGRLLISGYNLDGLSRPTLRVLEANGAAAAFAAPALRYAASVRVLAHLAGGKILVAGNFSHVNGSPVPFVLRLNPDLSRDPSFPNGPGPAAQVATAGVQPDGKIVLFLETGMMRLNADGSTDASFAGQSPIGFWYTRPPVFLPDGRIFLVTTSQYWQGEPVPAGFVVLDRNGARVSNHPFLPGPNPGGRVYGAELLPTGQLLVTGSFNTWNGAANPRAVRLNVDGSVDGGFTIDPSHAGTTHGLHLVHHGPSFQRDGKVILGVDSIPITMLRLNPNGSQDPSYFGALAGLSDIGRMLMQPDERLIVASSALRLGLDPRPNAVFTRLTRDGTSDSTFAVLGSRVWHQALIADSGELLSTDGTGYLHRYQTLPAPVIVAHPMSQSATAGASVSFNASASGQPPLTYQWTKDGTALIGATNATLTLDPVVLTAAGRYAVVVSNSGGSATSNAAILTVTPRPVAGVYFGSIGGTAGSFALLLRDNGTGHFLGYLRASRTPLVARTGTVDAARNFRFSAIATAPNGAETSYAVEGSVGPDGTTSGSIAGLNLALAGPPAVLSGPTNAYAGFYHGGAAGSGTNSYTIVGPAGGAFMVAVGGDTIDAGLGSVDASGRLTLLTENNARVAGTVQPDGSQVSTTFTRAAGGALTFTSAPTTRSDVEKLINISTRSTITTSAPSFTAGFYIAGDRAKPVLVRAIGPTLSGFQVGGALPAARLELFRGSTSLATATNWSNAPDAATIAVTAARVGAFALPAGSRDAALLLTLAPGAYSAAVSGESGALGVALIEVYDATEGAIPRDQRLINISTLANAGAGDATLAAGFYVAGTIPKRVLVRGVGPSLAQFGVSGVLTRPQVAVYSGGTVLAQNSGWNTTTDAAAISRASAEVGAFAFPAGSADAALIVHLAPGSYSAQVSGLAGTVGVALVEIYELP